MRGRREPRDGGTQKGRKGGGGDSGPEGTLRERPPQASPLRLSCVCYRLYPLKASYGLIACERDTRSATPRADEKPVKRR